jgi:hypothetical protein
MRVSRACSTGRAGSNRQPSGALDIRALVATSERRKADGPADAPSSQSDESGLSRDESADAHFCWDESGTKRDESAARGDSPPRLHDREHAPHDVRVRRNRLPRPPASPHVHPRVFIDKQVVPGFGTVNQHSHLRPGAIARRLTPCLAAADGRVPASHRTR